MTSKPPLASISNTTLSPGSSDSTPESPAGTGIGPGRLFNRLRLSIQSLASIQTALPEYAETASIRSFRPEISRATTHPAPLNPDKDSAISILPPRYPATPLNEYKFKIQANNPWVTLRVHTLSTTTPGHKSGRPHFTCNDPVSGVVELCLDSPQVVRRIILSVIGRVITCSLAEGRSNFLEHSVVLWAKEDGDPRNTDESAASTKVFDGKLQGSYEIPFSFPFPVPRTQITPSGPTGVTPFDLELNSTCAPPSSEHRNLNTTARFLSHADIPFPPTFQENGVELNIEYRLILRVVQGRFKSDSLIQAPFKYILATTPPPMSQSRRMAYEVKTSIPGPLADPGGWVKLPPARIMGQLILSPHVPPKRVSMECRLYLPAPLAYVRGTIIPCYLTLQSEDETTLHTLSNHKYFYIRLVRRLTYFSVGSGFTGNVPDSRVLFAYAFVPYQNTEDGGNDNQACKRALNQDNSMGYVEEIVKECAVATWWVPQKDVPQERMVRRLDGKIHLPKDLQPTCPSNILKIEYFVELLPPTAPEFEPFSGISSQAPSNSKKGSVSQSNPRMEVLVSQPVDIVTSSAIGDPVPVPFRRPKSKRRQRQPTGRGSGLVSPFPLEK